MTESENQKVAYLDTNTLHFIALYLNYAEDNKLYPFCISKQEEHDAALKHLYQILDKELSKSLRKGLHTICYMLDSNLQIEYSVVSEIELISGKARGKAIVNAAKEGIPDRMWSHLGEDEINRRLNLSDLMDIRNRTDNLSCRLEDLNIAVLNRGRTRDVLELAKSIAGLIYMSPIDAVIYASALVAHSDYLITADRYFQKTVNQIRCPDATSHYKEIQQQLITFIGPDLRLPFAFTIRADGKKEPSPPFQKKSLR